MTDPSQYVRERHNDGKRVSHFFVLTPLAYFVSDAEIEAIFDNVQSICMPLVETLDSHCTPPDNLCH